MKILDEKELMTFQQILSFYEDPFANLDQQALMACLKEVQSTFGFIPRACLPEILALFKTSEGIIKSLIHRLPGLKAEGGPRTVLVCSGPRCQEKGAMRFISGIEEILECKMNHVSQDGRFELRTQNCLRRCAQGKNLNIDTDIYTEMTLEKFQSLIDSIKYQSE